MFRNYLITAFRHLARHKLYSAINIFGFAVGLACCIAILIFVRGELSYDKFVPGNQHIYRVLATFHTPDGDAESATIMGPLGPALASDFADIEAVTRVRDETNAVKRGDVLFYETVIYADPTFFQTIPLPLVAGDMATAIVEPNTVVISEAMARKYFGDEDPVGQIMTFDGQKPMRVTGVLRDLPTTSHLAIDFLTNYRSATYNLGLDELETEWYNGNHYVYVRLKAGVAPESIEAQFPAFEARHFPDVTLNTGPVKGGDLITLSLQRFTDVHLHSVGLGNIKPDGDITVVYTFAGIALLILFIAAINFVVLTTARSTERAKEVGVRKVLGSTRLALVIQFLLETSLITFVAFLMALSISDLAMPLLGAYLDRPLGIDYASDAGVFGSALAVIAVVGLVAGAYPAIYMSAFKPAAALKGKLAAGRGHVRTGLVVMQFAISIALMIVTGVMFVQTEYMRSVRLGFNSDQMIVLRGVWRDAAQAVLPSLLDRLKDDPSVLSVNGQQNAPGDQGYEGRTFRVPGDIQHQNVSMESLSIDYGFLDAYQVKVLAGRAFSTAHQGDLTVFPDDTKRETAASAVITRSAAEEFGFASPEDAIGKSLDRLLGEDSDPAAMVIHYTIVGVVEDFQRRSARSKINPVVFYVDPGQFWSISIKARAGAVPEAMAHVEEVWRTLLPDLPVRAVFLDDRFAQLYQAEARQGTVFAGFAVLALVIACLGLFGLAAFTVERRTKEIGVRKVHGASTGSIVRLLVWQFSRPVIVANIIAWPVAYFVARDWLMDFNDRIDMSPVFFVAAGFAALGIAWLTVSVHAFRVARAKPVLALRYE